MNTALAIIEPYPPPIMIFDDSALVEINDLEVLIAAADVDVDAMRWRQAARVVALLDGGMTQRALARQWINGRTGKPYVLRHVQVVRKVFLDYSNSQVRPRFQDLYNAIANPSRFGNGDDDWFTPPIYIEATRSVLGRIDLDPASCAAANKVVKATRFFTIEDDGLSQAWNGKVWLNPPYSRAKIGLFVDKIVAHARAGDVTDAIVLTSSDTSTRWFATLYRHADDVVFPTGRLKFWKPDDTKRQPLVTGSAIFYFGPKPETFHDVFERFVWRGKAMAP